MSVIPATIITIWVALIGGGLLGWVLNIIKLFHMLGDPISMMGLARGAGVIFPPVGAILGWL